ncbi:MAG: hypothetical protein M3Q36_00370 [bacterium]|nr:hypothetical protein [bacterium]
MGHKVISLDSMGAKDKPNLASLIRDAVLDAQPEDCHGCPKALERSYRVGQRALREGLSPQEAAEWAWGNPGICCRGCVLVELLTPLDSPPTVVERELINA